MTATAPASTERSDLRHIILSGTKTGAITAGAVAMTLALYRLMPAGTVRDAVVTAVVLVAATGIALLPGRWVAARSADGVAGAAGVGLWGTVTFMVVDIAVYRPIHAYPWTWDAIGGGATWWYLPVWWMLGTWLAWMGALRLAAQGDAAGSLARSALPVVAGALVVAGAAAVTRCPVPFPVNAGAGFVGSLTALALVSVARKG